MITASVSIYGDEQSFQLCEMCEVITLTKMEAWASCFAVSIGKNSAESSKQVCTAQSTPVRASVSSFLSMSCLALRFGSYHHHLKIMHTI